MRVFPRTEVYRAGLVALVVALLAGCVGGAWAARASMVAPYVLPGATNTAIASQGLNKLVITYRADGQPYEWHHAIGRRLRGDGWVGREYSFTGTRAPFLVTWYTRSESFGPLTVFESAVVGGDPTDSHAVIVRVEREFRLAAP